MIGLDTTAIIDWFRGDNRLQRVLGDNQDPVASTQINYLELLFGLDLTIREHQREKEFYEELFSGMKHFTLNNSASQKTAEIFWTLKKKGSP